MASKGIESIAGKHGATSPWLKWVWFLCWRRRLPLWFGCFSKGNQRKPKPFWGVPLVGIPKKLIRTVNPVCFHESMWPWVVGRLVGDGRKVVGSWSAGQKVVGMWLGGGRKVVGRWSEVVGNWSEIGRKLVGGCLEVAAWF